MFASLILTCVKVSELHSSQSWKKFRANIMSCVLDSYSDMDGWFQNHGYLVVANEARELAP